MYLYWDSHHNIPSKYSVIGTLYHRANTICSTPQHLQKEEKHLNQALKKCKYPTWAINRAKLKIQATESHSTNRRTVNSNTTQPSRPKQNICSTLPSRFKVKVLRELAKIMESRCIVKEDIPSKTS